MLDRRYVNRLNQRMPSASITVIIAAYNAEATIARAVCSALAEPEVAEVIVVDDASKDGTVSAARIADDGSGRLKVIAQTPNAGPAAARNKAIAASSAPWITVLDADDFFLPGRMKGLLAAADGADLIADDMWQVDENSVDGPRRALIGERLTLPRTVSLEEFVLSNVTDHSRERAELGFIKPLMRRSFLDQNGIRYQEHMRLGEDYELYTRALAKGARLVLLPAQGYISVVRPNSLSSLHSEADLLNLRDCDEDLGKLLLSEREQKALRQHYLSVDSRLQWRLMIEAVKARNPLAAIKCFLRPWPVPAYVAGQLWEQFRLRVLKKA